MPLLLSTLALLIGLVILTWLHTQHRMDIVVRPAAAPAPPCPLISVCVPARNEERNIRRCVEALLAQDYPNFEVIVLDDRSSDATPQILAELAARDRSAERSRRSSRLRVLHGAELPPGWVGKTHALHQASAAARRDHPEALAGWLCFVDADTFAAPEALSSVYAKAIETQADLFTIVTEQIMLTFWERTLLPVVLTALSVGFSPRRVNDARRKDAIANGQFIFIKRPVYQALGGHAAIRDSIVDDLDLAVLTKRMGYRLIVAAGQRVARTRMYTSLPEMWEGWTKNIYFGLRKDPGLLLLGVFAVALAFAAALALPAWLLGGLIWWLNGGPAAAAWVALEAALVWAYLLFWRLLANRDLHVPLAYALTAPLGAAVFAAMMLVSAWKVLSGQGVTWKGRRYGALS